jgi:hypothetical protein
MKLDRLFHVNIAFLLIITFAEAQVVKLKLADLEEAMFRSNHDLKILRLKESFAEEQVIQSKSGYYPMLSSSWVVNEGKGSDTLNGSERGSSATSSSSIPSASSSNSISGAESISQNGWTGDITLSLGIFNRFSIQTALKNAKIGKIKDHMSVIEGIENKKSQLLQLILEINSLRSIRATLKQALILSNSIKKSKGKNSKALYSIEKSLKAQEFYSELDYQFSKIEFAWGIATQSLFDLIPEARENWINRLPRLTISFDPGTLKDIKYKFVNENIGLKKLAMDVDIFKNVYNQSEWEKPWIPQLNISSSLSKNRDWAGKLDDDESWRISALVTFNLFDGFYTKARRVQANLSYRMAQELEKSTRSKLLINLERQYRQSKMAKARNRYIQAKVERIKIKIKHFENISKSGVAMKNERTAALLELSKYQWEALDELKKYQQQLISMAQETNQSDKLRILYE